MDTVQFLKCILFFSLDRIIIYWNKLYDLRNLVGVPVWFVGPKTNEEMDRHREVKTFDLTIHGPKNRPN